MTTRSRERYGRLMLFAVLLFGVVTMHTLGHPSEQGMSSHGSPAVIAHRAHEPAHEPAHAPVQQSVTAVVVTAAAIAETSPMSGMDPLSLCLAVLGAFTLVLLLAAAFGQPWASGARPVVPLARLLRALWPNPPPPGSLLTRLSVLRQ